MNNTHYKLFLKKINEKKFFLIKVYSMLILQILIAFAVLHYGSKINIINSNYKFYGIVILMFLLVLLIQIIKGIFLKFIAVCIFSIGIGLLLSYSLDQSNEKTIEIQKRACITTIIIFIYTVLFGFFLNLVGFRMPPYVGICLFFFLLLLIIVSFVSSLSNTYSTNYKLISGGSIFLFTCFILYDTSIILEKEYNNNFVGASFDYFLDVTNLFINLIQFNQ